MQAVDLLINPHWIAPVLPRNTLHTDCSIVVDQGNIIGILPSEEAKRKYSPKKTFDLPQHLVIPGLVNAHGHAAMTLLRGFADDLPLLSWLNDHIWPAEGRWVSEEFVRDGTELAIAEMIRAGTTCFSDMYFFPDQVAEMARTAGIRAQIAFPILDFPTAWARDADEYLHKGLQLRDTYKNSENLKIAFGPHAVYTVSQQPLEQLAMLAGELDSCIQIHLHETAQEVDEFRDKNGVRPIQLLADIGLLSPLTQCVHMTQLNDADIELVQQFNASIVHCPHSNMKLASGIFPFKQVNDRGINIALGTDGAASNNGLDLFSEMKAAALLAKVSSNEATSLSANQALEMATINSACALGMDDRIGSIETGKSADLVAIDLSGIESQPLYNPVSQIVYTESASKVSHVWCQGKALLEEKELQTLNRHEILTKAKYWQTKIAAS